MKLCFFRGYIRNRKQLCQELGLPDSTGECAVLEAGYRRWSEALPGHLYGAFALTFHDPENEAFFCIRDQLGLEPFFYCQVENNAFLFGNDVNDILKDSRYHRAVDQEALQYYMTFGYPAGEKTVWQGIYKLLPGRTLSFRQGKIQIQTYYKPVYCPDYSLSEDEWTEEIDRTLEQILAEDRDNNDFGNACSFLSSGVDSSYLLAHSGVRRAVGIGFDGEDTSEAPLAAQTAKILNAGFYEVNITPKAYFDAIPKVISRTGLPLADASAIVFAIGCEKAAQSNTVCFSGEGADEFFAGYQIYRQAEKLGQTGGSWHYGCSGVMEPGVAARFLMMDKPFPCDHLVRELYEDSEEDEHLSRLLRIECALWLEGNIFFGVYRSAESNGLKLLLPYADRRMFELAARIPSDLKLKDGIGKYILRRAAEKRLPHEVAFRKKIGFSVPVRKWMRLELFRSEIEAVLFGPVSAHFFNQFRLHRVWTSFLHGTDSVWQIIYATYIFLIWAEKFGACAQEVPV